MKNRHIKRWLHISLARDTSWLAKYTRSANDCSNNYIINGRDICEAITSGSFVPMASSLLWHSHTACGMLGAVGFWAAGRGDLERAETVWRSRPMSRHTPRPRIPSTNTFPTPLPPPLYLNFQHYVLSRAPLKLFTLTYTKQIVVNSAHVNSVDKYDAFVSNDLVLNKTFYAMKKTMERIIIQTLNWTAVFNNVSIIKACVII